MFNEQTKEYSHRTILVAVRDACVKIAVRFFYIEIDTARVECLLCFLYMNLYTFVIILKYFFFSFKCIHTTHIYNNTYHQLNAFFCFILLLLKQASVNFFLFIIINPKHCWCCFFLILFIRKGRNTRIRWKRKKI